MTLSSQSDLQENLLDKYSAVEGKYQDHFLEQYKIYVEMADRISSRRSTANSFFLAVNTAFISIITLLYNHFQQIPKFWAFFPFIVFILLCYAWWRIIYSYRQLNSGKFRVIHLMEKNLPYAPYETEWRILGNGKDPKKYKNITYVENFVPFIFALLYFLLAIYIYFH